MLTAIEKKNLKKLLSMSGEPDNTFSYDELLGYMFGLAMTPEMLAPSEWMPIIFGGDLPEFDSMEQMQTMTGNLIQVYNTFIDDFHNHKLILPFNIEKLKENQLEALYEWISGFEEAIALREELWDPEEFPELSDRKKEELYHSMMTIQGLVDPVEVMDYFDEMPDDLFEEAFSGMEPKPEDRELQIQVFLMASLPLAIETFQDHARTIEQQRQRHFSGAGYPFPAPIRSAKVGRNDPCPCGSGKKYKKCCGGSVDDQPISSTGGTAKKSNVIKVDFPRHGKKKAVPAPVFQLKVVLQGAKPPIWRRIQVPGDITLERLHEVIQLCMGWSDSHLHQFLIDRICYCLPDEDDLWHTSRPKNEAKYTLRDLEKKIQPRFQYIYDFGDDWIHQITVEKVLPATEKPPAPVLLAGRRACPPEDIGGIHGYMHLLEVLGNPDHEEYEEMADRFNLDFFDPAQFGKENIAVINESLEELYPRSR
jgi:yecA family protein